MSRTLAALPVLLALSPFTPAQAPGCGFELVTSPNAATGETVLAALAVVSANDIWAVGDAAVGAMRRIFTMHWNGVRWTEVTAPLGTLAVNHMTGAVASASNDVWAVGYSSNF